MLLPLVLHHLGVVLKGKLAEAARGRDLGALVHNLLIGLDVRNSEQLGDRPSSDRPVKKMTQYRRNRI